MPILGHRPILADPGPLAGLHSRAVTVLLPSNFVGHLSALWTTLDRLFNGSHFLLGLLHHSNHLGTTPPWLLLLLSADAPLSLRRPSSAGEHRRPCLTFLTSLSDPNGHYCALFLSSAQQSSLPPLELGLELKGKKMSVGFHLQLLMALPAVEESPPHSLSAS
jgi:hypothetical protein